MLKTIVTSCPKYEYLVKNFIKLANRFYSLPFDIDIAKDNEKKSDQLLRILDGLKDKYYNNQYFILLEEDFYLLDVVKLNVLTAIEEYARVKDFDRFSLQSRNDYLYTDWNVCGKLSGENIFKADDKVKCLFSLEASVWNKSFLKNHLERGFSDREIETKMSDKIRGKEYTILALDEPIMKYKDACVGGQQRIKVEDGELYLLVQGGNGEDKWEYLNIRI